MWVQQGKCFRPRKGNYVSKSHNNWASRKLLRFRPRKGNYVSKYLSRICNSVLFSFRPRKGNYVSKSMEHMRTIKRSWVFVPVRGIMFLNCV